jgi:hypothetical protein
MTAVARASFLGLPHSVRNQIYGILFEDAQIQVQLNWWSASVLEAHSPNDTSIDNGTTLTNFQVRAEALPVLRQNLKVACYLPSAPIDRPIRTMKAEYRQSITHAEIHFAIRGWNFQFEHLPALSTVLSAATKSMSLSVIRVQIEEQTLHDWHWNGERLRFAEHLKSLVIDLPTLQKTLEMLRNTK